jgi:pimeloyl-ACP methyl ester carboxylesterase
MAAQVDPDPALGPLYLGGLSFGACVALEAAKVLRPRGVFFMSAGLAGRTIALPMRLVLLAAGGMTPGMLRIALRITPLVVRIVGRPNREQVALMRSLVPRVHLKMAIWGGPAIVRWRFEGKVDCPVYHIHGGIDHIVPVGNVNPTHVIRDAGHAVNVTHAQEVNRIITEVMMSDE